MGRWIAERAAPGQALVSTARRAVETWDGIASSLANPPPADFLPGLYHAAPERMLDTLNGARAGTVLMIGHNPGIAEFARRLPADPPGNPDFARFPTCATLIVSFPAPDWSAVDFGQGQAEAFMTPRRLPA